MNPYDPINSFMETVELRRKDYAARIEADRLEVEMIRSHCQFDEWQDSMRNRLVMEVRAAVYGKDHPQRHIIRYPADWLEALKERFAPSWIRDRWPVRFTEVGASLEETYPDIEPALPDKMPVMKFAVYRRDQYPIW